MTPRLLSIAAMVEHGARVIDVGTDHAYLPIYLAKKNIIISALATDVHDGPLLRADSNIKRFGMEKFITTQKADGLQNVHILLYDTVIIAGMGGELIANILEKTNLPKHIKLILQPMTAADALRRYLLSNGFVIQHEVISAENEKLYVVLSVVVGEENVPYTEAEYHIGRKSRRDPLYPKLIQREITKTQKQLEGHMHASVPDAEKIAKLKRLLEELEICEQK